MTLKSELLTEGSQTQLWVLQLGDTLCFFSHSKCTLTSCYAWSCHHFCQKQHLPSVPCFSAVPLQNNVCSSLKICRTNWESAHHTGSPNQTGEERHEIWSWLLTPLRGLLLHSTQAASNGEAPLGVLLGGRDGNQTMWSWGHVLLLQGRCKANKPQN